MKEIIFFLTFLTALLFFLMLWNLVTKNKILIQKRLTVFTDDKKKEEDDELNKPFKERIVQPILQKMSLSLLKLMPEARRQSLKKKLDLAGNPFNLKSHEFMGFQYGIAIFFAVSLGFTAYYHGVDMRKTLLFIVAFSYMGFKIPLLFLKVRTLRRQKEIDKSLPNIIDLLAVSVEAGLGFDAALAKVTVKSKGILAEELRKVLHEIKLGKSRREALKDLVYRTEAEDLANFISAVLQADGLGVSMSQILRIQSEQMRRKRRQRAEEEAMKAPVKMLFPMVFFIFPSIFIVLLGPAAIKIFSEFFLR